MESDMAWTRTETILMLIAIVLVISGYVFFVGGPL
jgi:hypothetical protein